MSRLSKFFKRSDRTRVIADERARVRRIVERALESRRVLEARPMTAAVVFLHDSIHAGRGADDPKDIRSGQFILRASEPARRLILVATLNALARAPLSDSSWEVNIICDLRFLHDHHWGRLVKAILRTRLAVPANW